MRNLVGLGASLLAIAFTLSGFEQYLRIAGAVVSLTIGVLILFDRFAGKKRGK